MNVTLVIPCYNEERRLPRAAFRQFLATAPDVRLLCVDDGSRDGTLACLQQMAAQSPGQVEVLALERNLGKAEAVRRGLQQALSSVAGPRPDVVGYWDADLAAPLQELPRLLAAFSQRPELRFVQGVRLKLMGWDVDRRLHRHYANRVFATCAAAALGQEIYDTQCGAKLLRVDAHLPALLEEPMRSPWLVDVELLFRLRNSLRAAGGPQLDQVVLEVPLQTWHEVGESKVRMTDFVGALWHLWRLHRCYRRAYGR